MIVDRILLFYLDFGSLLGDARVIVLGLLGLLFQLGCTFFLILVGYEVVWSIWFMQSLACLELGVA